MTTTMPKVQRKLVAANGLLHVYDVNTRHGREVEIEYFGNMGSTLRQVSDRLDECFLSKNLLAKLRQLDGAYEFGAPSYSYSLSIPFSAFCNILWPESPRAMWEQPV